MYYALKNKETNLYYTSVVKQSVNKNGPTKLEDHVLPKTFASLTRLESHLSERVTNAYYKKYYENILGRYDICTVEVKGSPYNEQETLECIKRIQDKSIKSSVKDFIGRKCTSRHSLYFAGAYSSTISKKDVEKYQYVLMLDLIAEDVNLVVLSKTIKKAIGARKSLIKPMYFWKGQAMLILLQDTDTAMLAKLVCGSFNIQELVLTEIIEKSKQAIMNQDCI